MHPRNGTRPRVDGPAEPRGRWFDRKGSASEALSTGVVSVTQAMEILERIAERRAGQLGITLHLADRIQPVPEALLRSTTAESGRRVSHAS